MENQKPKLQAAAVSYLNTKPFLYGVFSSDVDKEIDIHLDIPSQCAARLKNGEVDLGLVPVAIIPELSNPHIISDYCIGTVGAVQTVAIFSEVPLEEITHLYLDFHSRSSVQLVQILLREYWHHQPQLLKAEEGFIHKTTGTTAAVVIGDRCIGLDERYPYIYDLGTAWQAFTGLPFVFAAWVANKPLPADFIERFNAGLAKGLAYIPKLIKLLPTPKAGFDLDAYYNQFISYEFDLAKKQGLAKFLTYLNTEPLPKIQTEKSIWNLSSLL